jgi:hypothetical protein
MGVPLLARRLQAPKKTICSRISICKPVEGNPLQVAADKALRGLRALRVLSKLPHGIVAMYSCIGRCADGCGLEHHVCLCEDAVLRTQRVLVFSGPPAKVVPPLPEV